MKTKRAKNEAAAKRVLATIQGIDKAEAMLSKLATAADKSLVGAELEGTVRKVAELEEVLGSSQIIAAMSRLGDARDALSRLRKMLA